MVRALIQKTLSLSKKKARKTNVYPCVAENMIGTLTSSILKSVHTSTSLIFSYNKLCSVATPGHPKPLLLENHVRIVALTPDL
jgi:hypothetical protein